MRRTKEKLWLYVQQKRFNLIWCLNDFKTNVALSAANPQTQTSRHTVAQMQHKASVKYKVQAYITNYIGWTQTEIPDLYISSAAKISAPVH